MASLIRPRSPNIVRRSKSIIFALRRDPVERLAPEGWKGRPRGWTGPWTTGAASALGLGLWFLASLPAEAQNLANLPGQTDLQSRVGVAVVAVCGPLAAAGTNRNGPSATEDLFGRCQDLVHTSNAVAGTGPTAFSLGLTAAQTNDSLLQIAHEESAAQGTGATETAAPQAETLSARLGALRGGATGISLAGLTIRKNGQAIPGVALAALIPGGGAASGQDAGGDEFGRWGGFVNGTISLGDKDATAEEAGFDFFTGGVTAGLDYRFSDKFVAGVAVGYTKVDNDFDASAGGLDVDEITVSIFASFFPTDNFYVDLIGSYSRQDYDLTRNIVYPSVNRRAVGDTDGNEFSVSAGAGYDFSVQGWTIGPYVRVDYVRADIDSFTETGALGLNLAYNDQDVRSFSSVVGAQASYAISTDFGIVLPQARADWAHEFKDDSRLITVRYAADPAANLFTVVTDGPDRNFFHLGVSVSLLFAGGVVAFADYETVLGLRDTSNHVFTVGARLEF